MLREIKILSKHGRQYVKDLRKQAVAPLFRGRPIISGHIEASEARKISGVCPVMAISEEDCSIDIGKCVFCMECSFRYPERISFTNDYRIASNRRKDLVIKPGDTNPLRLDENSIRKEIRKLFRNALKLRQVSAGGDNSAEMELNAAGNVNFDMGRYGIEFVASPRHADGIVITGPVSENMSAALELTWKAVPAPAIIILAGTDAISAGIFEGSPALNRKFIDQHPIDIYVPGNPPHPLTFINGILDLVGIDFRR
jgi:Ni,Fe-hydrogenase III small subunit